MPKKGQYQIPFDKHGNQLHYPILWGVEEKIEWRSNHEFNATMTFRSMHSGRSAKYFSLIDDEGHKYTMFGTDLLDLITRGMINQGKVSERWTFIKRGQNYGIKMVNH